MIYHKTFPPALALRPYVQSYILIGQADGEKKEHIEEAPPFPAGGLCFNYIREAPLFITHNSIAREELPGHYVLSPSTERYKVHYKGDQFVLAAQFRLGKFYEFFGWPLHLFTDRIVGLADTEMQQPFQDLFDQIGEAGNISRRIGVLDNFLLRRLNHLPHISGRLDKSLSLIARKRGNLRRGELAEMNGLTPRHLRRLFDDFLGMPPQAFLRIYRFYQALSMLKTGGFDNLAGLALEIGYYDQAHFTRDFREYTGLPPLKFVEHHSALAEKLAWRESGHVE